jgi:hypothetical protein
MNTAAPARSEALRQALLDEVLHYFNWPESGWRRRLIEPLFRRSTRRFIRIAATFDEQVAQVGFCEASRRILPEFIPGVEARGVEHIPASGPLIVAANHPGAVDSLVAASQLPRDDFKIIARGMPFLRGLPAACQYIIFEKWDDLHMRTAALRSAIHHLRRGGVLVLFPSGDLDPDPACLPGAPEALETWSASLELMLRTVPEACLQVAIMSRLLEPRYLGHPIARLRKDRFQRQVAAEMLQMIQQMFLGRRSRLAPLITFAPPLRPNLPRPTGERAGVRGDLRQQILAQARLLISEHTAPGSPVLQLPRY